MRNFQHKKRNGKFGFTLLEVLVVVAIAGMILSFTLVSIRSAKQRSRDSRREEDVKQILSALSIYAATRGIYPICASEIVIGSIADTCVGPALVADGAFQAGTAPADPLFSNSGSCGTADSYGYCYQSATGYTYQLRYALEADGISGKLAGWQPLISP